jgi:hypothetical protein
MIEPTVGRVVLYHPPEAHPDVEHLAAIVTYVWSSECVNLVVFDANGEPFARKGIFLFQGEGERPANDFAEWMPYQIGQAKKHEAA